MSADGGGEGEVGAGAGALLCARTCCGGSRWGFAAICAANPRLDRGGDPGGPLLDGLFPLSENFSSRSLRARRRVSPTSPSPSSPPTPRRPMAP